MTTVVVPERRFDPDPNRVIDYTKAKDSTAGLQQFVSMQPPDTTIVLPRDVLSNGTPTLNQAKKFEAKEGARLISNNTYPYRVVPDLRQTVNGKANPFYNPDGVCAPFMYDLTHSLKNQYGREDDKQDFGGYDGTTGASGMDYDGLHLSTRVTAPFKAKHRMAGVRVLAGVNTPDKWFSQIITSVAPDGKTVFWKDREGSVPYHEDSTHTCAWAVNAKLGWAIVYTPNPAYNPRYITDKGWKNYEEALRICNVMNRSRTNLILADNAQAINVEVDGSNDAWGQPIISLDQYGPVVNEFQHGIFIGPQAKAIGCEVHHVWGDGLAGPGERIDFKVHHCGRQGMVGHHDNIKAVNGVIDLCRHSSIDFEGPAAHNVHFENIIMGNHGIAMSTPVINGVFKGIKSRQQDVDNGTITSLTPLVQGPAQGGPGSKNITYEDCDFDIPQKNFLVAQNIDGLHVKNCKANTSEYFVKTYYKQPAYQCTNVDVTGNDGGPKCDGQVQPVPK